MSILNTDTTPQPMPRRVTRALLRWVMHPARVAAVETLSPHFRLIDLESEVLKDIAWLPGQKVQIAIGSGLSSRTYTPMSWDAGTGRMRLLAFLHGDGPGSCWAANLLQGESCQFLGPRSSLDFSGTDGAVMLFGDETSFGLGAALQRECMVAELVFEVSDAAESRAVLAAIGLAQATVIKRGEGDAHLAAIGADLSRHVASGARFVLTGQAQSIQSVNKALKKSGVASSNVKSKAYWSPGKAGLD